jgi:general secretion pathway protein C
MQNLIKRYFWVLGGVVVAVCSVFAAKATSHIVEAKFLSDPDHGPKVVRVADASTPATPAKAVHSKDGTQFEGRNMFCSECTPSVDVAAKASDPSIVPLTGLPLQLLATNVGVTSDQSYATIVDTENQHQGSYSIGDPMPGAKGGGKIKLIHFKFVDFENDGRTERLVLVGAQAPVTVAVEAPSGDKDEMSAAIDSGIKKINDTTYDVDKSLLDKILANPMAVSKGARIVPAMKNGKPEGFKLYAIRADSLYGKLGLVNGDTLNSINGFELTSADKALEAYTKLREATALQVDITRHGESTKLTYNIK